MPVRDSEVRRKEIVRLAMQSGLTSVDELSNGFGVSASTIRRDLAQLEQAGRLARTYGGAIATVAHPESTLRERVGEAFDAKHAIARWAAAQVQIGETILLDAGSTVGALAHELRQLPELTVVTTSLTVVAELAGSAVTVICLGGTLRPLSQAFIGPLAEAALERLSFDRIFLGADGVSATDGICEAELEQTRLKELMARRSGKIYVLAHAEKLERRPFHAWAKLPVSWTLVTDDAADPVAVAGFSDRGIAVQLVNSDR